MEKETFIDTNEALAWEKPLSLDRQTFRALCENGDWTYIEHMLHRQYCITEEDLDYFFNYRAKNYANDESKIECIETIEQYIKQKIEDGSTLFGPRYWEQQIEYEFGSMIKKFLKCRIEITNFQKIDLINKIKLIGRYMNSINTIREKTYLKMDEYIAHCLELRQEFLPELDRVIKEQVVIEEQSLISRHVDKVKNEVQLIKVKI